jgi:2,4-dienoyl-CoA reductase-like NADH-dependent reductase (Old Yellow Enzyme family)
MATRTLFEPTWIAGLQLRSSLVRSATAERIPLETEEQALRLGQKYAELARGGVGLIITGHIAVDPTGRASQSMPGIYSDSHTPLWRIVCDTARAEGAVLCAQLNHAGGRCKPEHMGPDRLLFHGPVCVSALPQREKDPMAGRELTPEDIKQLVKAYAAAALRARSAGMNAVQIHAAHGYLVSQFLSPITNRRDDGWGGPLAGRARFLRQIVRAVRDAMGPHFPIGVKLGAMDEDTSTGLSIEDSIELGKWLEQDSLSFIEISGAFRSDIAMRNVRAGRNEAYYLPVARRFKQALHIPVIAVGGFRTLAVMNEALASEACDAISMSRPLIRQPDAMSVLRDAGQFDCLGCSLCLFNNTAETQCWSKDKSRGA